MTKLAALACGVVLAYAGYAGSKDPALHLDVDPALHAEADSALHADRQQTNAARPNVVLMFPDNLGIGEVGAYGGVRGAPTPRLDKLAAEGLRMTNFNVEFSCTVSRAALMTGRYAIRTGATQ